MSEKYKNYSLQELTLKYFDLDNDIIKLDDKKYILNETISKKYDEKNEIHILIKKKQDEEAEIRRNNLIKYGLKVQLADNEELNRNYN
jgi:hypothetical protein